jgi:hypothetical protein
MTISGGTLTLDVSTGSGIVVGFRTIKVSVKLLGYSTYVT